MVYTPFPRRRADQCCIATLFLGGSPARYDGGLSYVLDMETRGGRRGDEFRTAGSMDLLSARAIVEKKVPISSHAGYMATARDVHGLGPRYAFNDPFFPYRLLGPRASFSMPAPAAACEPRASGTASRSVSIGRAISAARWGNRGSLRYKGVLGGADPGLSAGYGSFEATLPIGGSSPLLANGEARRLRLAADLGHGIGPMQVHYGASFDHIALHYRAFPRTPATADNALLLETEATGDDAGVYFDASAQAGPRVKVRGGLRTDVFTRDQSLRYGPRLAVTLLLSDHAALTLAGGQYHQYVRAAEVAILDVDPLATDSLGTVAPLAVARASHFVVALDQDIGIGLRLGLQGYFKTYEGMPDPAEADSHNKASGVDLWLRRSTGRLTGWLGYSLAWAWTMSGHQATADQFSGRQLVDTGITGPIGARGRFDLPYRLRRGAALHCNSGERGRPRVRHGQPALQHGADACSSRRSAPAAADHDHARQPVLPRGRRAWRAPLRRGGGALPSR